ncbi:hypothetical protein AWH56_010645 [Anaerobacillus isosaccharinicus]|uniref:ParB/Sulfiredoxin domain-containing protein n=1 Tax=Anaerobacillus isosaccharinicus TaxID=1532552 RepID=A0A1S2L7F5_9BACI|nr:hypothetical protein [Anaerobacillus isosaccharinicus]MBA5588611.1 hypothetical protein [Anaerobacillus isosaccharinicus]QOY37978.1 hypothetical protein AWH56_010645 [Anaerobacillus isosaccharinicus]
MLSFVTRRYFKTRKQFEKKYGVNYHIFSIGIKEINPKDIEFLSLPEEKVSNDDKMLRLRLSFIRNGWTNEHPSDLALDRLPNKKFTVGSGGNHRAYLAKKQKLKKIKAHVYVLVPKQFLITINEQLDNCYKEIERLRKEAADIRRRLDEIDDSSDTYNEEYKYFDLICEKENYYWSEIDRLVKEVALKNKLVTEEELISLYP